MGILNLEYLEPGMKLGKDVIESNGRVLLRAGTVISERHLKVFQTWGITEAYVVGADQEVAQSRAEAGMDGDVLIEARKHVAYLFRHSDKKHPAVSELIRLCIKRRVEAKNREP